MNNTDETFLGLAIEKASQSVAEGGFPAGSVIARDGRVIGEGVAVGNLLHDPTSHDSTAAIRTACHTVQSSDLSGSVLYASMQPCIMCLSAAMWAGITRVVFACPQDKVSPAYYGGHYDTCVVNKSFLRPLAIEHLLSLEQRALEVIHMWEAKTFPHS